MIKEPSKNDSIMETTLLSHLVRAGIAQSSL